MSLLADTGLRLSEVAGINREDVDSLGRTIRFWGKGAKQLKLLAVLSRPPPRPYLEQN